MSTGAIVLLVLFVTVLIEGALALRAWVK